MVTVQASSICDHVTLYLKSFNHQSTTSSEKTPMHEAKQKHTVLTLKQKMEIGKRPENGENHVKI
jgi:hypothetical protein